jgi:polyvinyl alcohol dehydrogenase (cytochrome)
MEVKMVGHVLLWSLMVLMVLTGWPSDVSPHNWTTAGGDRQNTRNSKGSPINPANISSLTVAWDRELTGNISATPAVQGQFLYVTDWGNVPTDGDEIGGSLWKINSDTGDVIWRRKVEEYTGIPGDFARGTPTIVGGRLIISNQAARLIQARIPMCAAT